MAMFVRSKRVTDPLDDRVKACICGFGGSTTSSSTSSGSEHEGEFYESPCLSNLVHGFLEAEADVHEEEEFGNSSFVRDLPNRSSESAELIRKNLLSLTSNTTYKTLLSHVSIAVEMFGFLKPNKSAFLRRIVTFLREVGHNAGVCKTRWESGGSITAGSYEFIDVVRAQERYFVDVDFAAEFDIARPTIEYQNLLMVLPKIYVAKSASLKEIVKLMCDAAKRSLKCRDLHLPPWRKNRYMQLKWFAAYRRTVNPVSSTVSVCSGFEKFTVKCRSVGFDAISDGTPRFVLPAATRTR